MNTLHHAIIRLLVVDDHDLFRRGLMALLGRDSQLCVVGDASNAEQALQMAVELQPDVILLDNHMLGVNGINALPSMLAAAPKAHIMMLTISEDEVDLQAALNGGARAYLLKTMSCDDLTASVHRVLFGEIVIAPEMKSKLNSNCITAVAKACF